MLIREREVTAVHEAGHCLVAERLGYHVKKAWIYTKNDEHGEYNLYFKSWLKRIFDSFISPENVAMLIKSGIAAQKLFFPDSKIFPSDINELKKLQTHHILNQTACDNAEQRLQIFLSDENNLIIIKEITQVLDRNGSITGYEIREIISSYVQNQPSFY